MNIAIHDVTNAIAETLRLTHSRYIFFKVNLSLYNRGRVIITMLTTKKWCNVLYCFIIINITIILTIAGSRKRCNLFLRSTKYEYKLNPLYVKLKIHRQWQPFLCFFQRKALGKKRCLKLQTISEKELTHSQAEKLRTTQFHISKL